RAGGSAGANQITNTGLQAQLALGNVVIATDSAGAESGHITVESGASLSWSSGNSLALLAHGDIRFNASVQATGSGGLTAVAGWDGATGFGPGSGVHVGAVDFGDFVSQVGSYGNGNGSIYVGDGTQGSGIAVGSRAGATQMAAHGLHVLGGSSADAYGQL